MLAPRSGGVPPGIPVGHVLATIMRLCAPTALFIAALTLGILSGPLSPSTANAQMERTAAEHRQARPPDTPLRRGPVSVPRWSLLTAGAGVVALGVLALVRMQRRGLP